jgi:hypothetical protein
LQPQGEQKQQAEQLLLRQDGEPAIEVDAVFSALAANYKKQLHPNDERGQGDEPRIHTTARVGTQHNNLHKVEQLMEKSAIQRALTRPARVMRAAVRRKR